MRRPDLPHPHRLGCPLPCAVALAIAAVMIAESSGGYDSALRAHSCDQTRQIAYALDAMVVRTLVEVNRQYINVIGNEERIRVLAPAEQAGRSSLAVRKAARQHGLGSILDLLRERDYPFQPRAPQIQAQARVALEVAAGRGFAEIFGRIGAVAF